MAEVNTTVLDGYSRILFRERSNPNMIFTAEVIGLRLFLEGDYCDVYFELEDLDIIEVINDKKIGG